MKISQALNIGTQVLIKNNIKSPSLDSEILMSKAIKKDKKFIILNSNQMLEEESFQYFKSLIKQRSTGKPIAYLTGNKSFWNYNFKTSPDVLIPRPDTELIIDEVLKIVKYKKKLNILDIGIGSGCILLTILKEKKDFYGVGLDISKKCLDISRINASILNLNNRVKFFKSDVDNFKYGKYDLIISNPPYIKKFDLKYLDKDVINFEPKIALDGGLEGLSEIRKVINKSSELIKINGKLVLEIAYDQKREVVKLLKEKGFYINKILKDLANNYRCIISTKIIK